MTPDRRTFSISSPRWPHRAALTVLVLLLAAAPVDALETRWQVEGLSARLILTDPAAAEADSLTLAVALPAHGDWRAEALRIDGRSLDPSRHLRLSPPGIFRHQRLGRLLVTPPEGLRWERMEIRLAFDAVPPAAGRFVADPLLAGLLVNPPAAAPGPRSAGSREASDFFDGSGRWLRLDVAASGVYRLGYDDLVNAGVAPGTDMAGFRLLGSQGKSQPFRVGWGGSWRDEWTPTEVPLQVVGGTSLNPDSELRFYLAGADGFGDEFEAGADFEAYHRNAFTNWATYHLTWGGADGARVPVADASLQGDEIPQTTVTARLHREKNRRYSSAFLFEDGWAWHYFDQIAGATALNDDDMDILWPAAGGALRMRIGFDAPTLGFPDGPHHVQGYLTREGYGFDEAHKVVDEVFDITSDISSTVLAGEIPLPADLEGEEDCTFWLRLPRGEGSGLEEDFGWLLWYELYYATRPRTRASAPMEFHLPASPGRVSLAVSGWSHEPEVWDLSDPAAPSLLTGGFWAGDSLQLGLAASVKRLLLVDPAGGGGYPRPDRVLPVNPEPLRNDAIRPQMVVVYFDGRLDQSADSGFRAAASRYAAWRREHFPVTDQGVVEVVGISDIYANFSSGMQDLAALRNFLKYRYDAPDSRLGYTLFLGDTSQDYRNYLSRDVVGDVSEVLVPSLSSRFLTEQRAFHYTTEDYFVNMDAMDDSLEVSIPDIAVGRLPAPDAGTADQMVDMVIAYERDADPGIWRNRIALAADDYTKNCIKSDGIDHTGQAEILVRDAIPAELDIEKIYMCEWECDYSGFKPEAQNHLFATLEEGVQIFNYVGHGGNDVLSDEVLLLSERLPSLNNDGRRYMFISASCNVGKFDDTQGKSMSEEMLSMPQGGAIGTMASSALSSAGYNNVLNRNFLQQLFPEGSVGGGAAIGAALLRSKVKIQQVDYSWPNGLNNERYAILGDPALRLHGSELQVAFDPERSDTLEVGGSLALGGQVLRDGLLAADFDGELHLSVRASADISGYSWVTYYNDLPVEHHVDYHLLGPEIFRGRIAVAAGRFTTPAFFVPGLPDSALGDYGRIRAYASCEGTGETAVGVLDALVVAPGILPAEDTPPTVRLRLAGGATHGTPGMRFEVRASSPSGINLVGNHPRNAIFIEYVESGEVQNLTQEFQYDLNSATDGLAAGALPSGLPEGYNTLVASVADNLGNVGRDTLRVKIFEEGRADLQAVWPFPNPFQERCAISFELTAPARVRCELYTVSGRRIRSLEGDYPTAGRWALEWDGRDAMGDQVANGTYLYRMEAVYTDNDARRRERTGALVRMRD